MKGEENALKDSIEIIKHLWLHRRGNEVPAAVQDTIDALYKDPMKPLIIKKSKGESSWFIVINLPPGCCYREFKAREHFFQDATGGAVHIEKRGKAVYLEVMTDELKNNYPYKLWQPEKYNKLYLPIPIGISARGEITRDLTEMPHIFIAGEPDYGKSNELHVIAVTLLLHRHTTSYLVLLDFKHAEFGYLEDYTLLINDITRARLALTLLNKLIDERLKLFRSAKVRKIQSYLARGYEMPFVTIIVDELAEMQDADCQAGLERIARLGRAVGLNIVAATQRPSSTLYEKFGDIKAMFPCRMCFLVADAVNSNMILDNDRAAQLPAIKGRAVYRWGIEQLEVQAYFLDADKEAPRLLDEHFKNTVRVVNCYDSIKLLEQPQKRLSPR